MELIVKNEEQGWDFQVISEDFEERFVSSVLAEYEDSVEEQVTVFPQNRAYDIRLLIEGFEATYMMYESIVEADMFPDLDWDSLTDDDRNEITAQVVEEAYDYDHLFLADVLKILNTFQLFYTIREDGELDATFFTYVNSPLQEVW